MLEYSIRGVFNKWGNTVVSAQVVEESDTETEASLSSVKLGYASASGSDFLDRYSGE